MTPSAPTRRRLAAVMAAVGLLAAVAAALGIGVPATNGGHVAVDEPQYLLSALSVWEDGNLDISDELAADRARSYHAAELPVQTMVRPDGSQVSPHDPLLAVLLAPAVGLGGWVAAKAVLAALAGVLAALLVWLAVRRLAVPLPLAGSVVAVAFASAPLAVYGQQVYPELPAALAVTVAVVALTGPHGRGGTVALLLAVVALPWLSVKYAPVAAVLAAGWLLAQWRDRRRREAGVALGVLGLAGAVFLVVHRAVYGGWTAYASGDHFQSAGELGVVGTNPDYAGRGTRVVGLLVDRDFGLVAWQPAWLLIVPALVALPWLLSRRWPVLMAPLVTGWLVASFVALTMHGFWWPGRQVVLVLPLAVLAVAVWLTHLSAVLRPPIRGRVFGVLAVLAGAGVAAYGWVLASGWIGALTWVGAPDEAGPGVVAALRSVLPDYRELGAAGWSLHAAWVLVLAGLAVGAALSARRHVVLQPSTASLDDHYPVTTQGAR